MSDFHLTANLLERYLQKPSEQFTLDDIINYVFEKEIEMINFRYVADDEKLKTLNFVVTGKSELENLLKYGERVNGNSVFRYNIEYPDLYVIPKFSTAFVNPFTSTPTLDILCSFYTWEGEPLKNSPENILLGAIELFQTESGYDIKMFGELEYYVISEIDNNYQTNEGHYQSSEPFSKFEKIRVEAMKIVAQCGGKIRFGHAEHGSFNHNGKYYEQHEIEFLPSSPIEAIEQLIVAKWILRMLGKREGVDISFSPKVAMDKPGNGLHFHFILEKDHINILGEGSEYRIAAMQMIAGILKHAGSLTAFGNSIPVSYLRLADTQQAPHFVCWGPSNRSALIRIPKINMKALNGRTDKPRKGQYDPLYIYNQTIEYRGADASGYLYFFVAALLTAGVEGFSNHNYMKMVKSYLVTDNLHSNTTDDLRQTLEKLPASCKQAAQNLTGDQHFYTSRFPVFPDEVIQFVINQHLDHYEQWENQKTDETKLIQNFIHYK